MADAIISMTLERLAAFAEEKIREEVNLVRGVKEEVHHLSSKLKTMRDVLEDAERRGFKEKTIQNWLKRLEDVSYDIDDVLDEWSFVALKLQIEGSKDFHLPRMKVCPPIQSSCMCFNKVSTRRDIAVKIKGLNEKLTVILNEKDEFNFIVNQPHVDHQDTIKGQSTSSIDLSDIHGRGDDKDVLVSKLMHEVAGQQLQVCPQVISIVGVGGIGKTTLAQFVFNDDLLVNCFKLRIWVCVSNVFDEVKIAKAILESVNGKSPDVNELNELVKHLEKSISRKKFLLVLDDVWTEDIDKWEPLETSLKFGAPGSKILVTTRSERVARMMGTTEVHRLGELSHWDCWLLMKRIAFHGRSEGNYKKLHDIGEKIATKCKGLPLAAKVLGSLLRSKDTKEEWESIFDSEIWQLEDVKIKLFPHLSLSYNELSPAMKRCFSYCAIFPKDSEIDVEKLVRMWMGLGYLSSTESTSDLELRGKEYFNNLKMRSFFQDFVEYDGRVYCKMHDIVHDFARFLMKTKSQDPDRTIDARIDESFQAYDPSLVSQVKVYRSLVRPKELPNELFDYVTCLRLLSLGNSWWQDIPKGMENLIHLRYLDVSGHRLAAQVLQSICKLYYLQTLYLSYCALEEIPREIGYLIHLRHLDLSWNFGIKELPESMCNMHDLRTLNLAHCESLSKLPEGIDRLVNLRHLSVDSTENLCQIPRGLEKLTGLQTLRLFHAGKGWSKLGYLKKLDQLSGSLELRIKLHGREDVDEALKAELKSKEHIESLTIWFFDEMGRTGEEVLVRNAIIEALQPPPNLQYLRILEYQGSRVPSLTSLNHLRVLHIQQCNYISSLGCLGKLPELEELLVWGMGELKFLGSWEFLGLAGDIDMDGSKASSGVVVRFPKLKKLDFSFCPRWEVWEDITQEEDSSGTVSVMPYLRELRINNCGLMELPHQLLLKASSLEHLTIEDSVHLWERYEEHKGPGRRLLSHIPHVRVSFVRQTPY